MEGVVEYLRSKGVQVYPARSPEVTVHCLWCPPGHGGAKARGKMYVNAETGLFKCHVCDQSGGMWTLYSHYGDDEQYKTEQVVTFRLQQEATQAYGELAHSFLSANPSILNGHLLSRGLSIETVMDAMLGYSPRGNSICHSILNADGTQKYSDAIWKATGLMTAKGTDFLAGKITIPYFSQGQIVQVRGKQPDGRYYTPTANSARLYNIDAARDVTKLIVTEGEFDCLILQQALQELGIDEYAVVGLPGVTTWKEFLPWFEQFQVVLLGFDPDKEGAKQTRLLKTELGSRGRAIQLPMEVLPNSKGEPVEADWTEWLRPLGPDHPHGGHTAEEALSLVTQAEMDGKILFSMREALAEHHLLRTQSHAKLGFAQLDSAIMPGLYPGSVTIVLARTGTGKSVILSNIAYNTRDVPVMTVTLENTKAQVVEHLQRVIRFEDPLADDQGIDQLMCNWAVADPNRLTLKALEDLVDIFTVEHRVRPRLVLIDHLAYMAQGQPGNGSFYEKTTQAIFSLKEMAKSLGVAIVCPSQVSRKAEPGQPVTLDDARDAGTIAETADFVLAAWRPGMAVEGHLEDGEMMLELLKSRHGNTGKRFKLMFSAHSLRMVDQTSPREVLERIRVENHHYNQSWPYESYFQQQKRAAWEKRQQSMSI